MSDWGRIDINRSEETINEFIQDTLIGKYDRHLSQCFFMAFTWLDDANRLFKEKGCTEETIKYHEQALKLFRIAIERMKLKEVNDIIIENTINSIKRLLGIETEKQ